LGRSESHSAGEIRGPSKPPFIPFIESFAVTKILKAVDPNTGHSFIDVMNKVTRQPESPGRQNQPLFRSL
jgi:hypothetical protein